MQVFTTRTDAMNDFADAFGSEGADGFDIEGIFDECYAWSIHHNGFVRIEMSDADFAEILDRNRTDS